MARTPTDPTKAQVWIDKGIDDLAFEFYIPSGPKGDPGGITLGTTLNATSNLNEYKTSGVYRLGTTYSGLLLFNFPRDTDSGVLVVYERVVNQTLIQEFHSMQVQGRGFYLRHMTNTDVWSSWRFVTTSRVDQTAGRAIYQWDDVNNRDQLVYGDTGERDISVSNGNGTFAALKVRRYDSLVTVWGVGWVPPANGAPVLNTMLPIGFRNPNTMTSIAVGNGSQMRALTLGANFSNLTIGGNVTSESYNFSISYPTVDSWPTALPGSAVGVIGAS